MKLDEKLGELQDQLNNQVGSCWVLWHPQKISGCNVIRPKYHLSFFHCKWFCVSRQRVTDSCRDGWNIRNCSSSQVQVFRDWWNVQIDGRWNVPNWLNMNFLNLLKSEYEYSKICVVSIVRAQTLSKWWNQHWCRCFGCLGCTCLVCCLECMIHKIGLYTSLLWYERDYP